MKYYIPIPILKAESPLMNIEDDQVERNIRHGAFVNILDGLVQVSGSIDEKITPWLPDFFETPYPLVSKKIANVISEYAQSGTQLIPVNVLINSKHYDNYHLLNVTQFIDVIDEDNSNISRLSSGTILSINKLVLNKDKINEISEQKLMLFRVSTKPSIYVFSSELVELIKAVNPTGIDFIEAEYWYSTLI